MKRRRIQISIYVEGPFCGKCRFLSDGPACLLFFSPGCYHEDLAVDEQDRVYRCPACKRKAK